MLVRKHMKKAMPKMKRMKVRGLLMRRENMFEASGAE